MRPLPPRGFRLLKTEDNPESAEIAIAHGCLVWVELDPSSLERIGWISAADVNPRRLESGVKYGAYFCEPMKTSEKK